MSAKQSYTLTCLLNDYSVNVECDGKKYTCSPISICIPCYVKVRISNDLQTLFFFSLELHLSHISNGFDISDFCLSALA